MRTLYSCALALLLASCVRAPTIVLGGYEDGYRGPELDVGGNPAYYRLKAQQAREHKLVVEIRGRCDSACVLKLLSGENLCIHPLAVFGLHETRTFRPGRTYATGIEAYGDGVRDSADTEQMRKDLPSCAARVFARYGAFSSSVIVRVSGQEVLEACPQIKKCSD